MVALAIPSGIQAAKLQVALPAVASLIHRIQQCNYSTDDVKPLKTAKLSSMKRGTGGRSSFSGIVATVFGANGFLGEHVCNRLGKIGSQIIVPYRGDAYELIKLRLVGDLGQVLFLPFNLRDEESIYNAVKYSNVVINLIGRDWETKNFSFKDVNVDGAVRIAKIAKQAGVEKLIHISDLNAAQNPKPHLLPKGSRYLATKWEGEQAVREVFPEAIIFKPSFMCGENDKFLKIYTSIMRHTAGSGLAMYKKGEHTIKQPVFVSDVAAAIVQTIRDKDCVGKTIQAVGPKRYKLSDLVDWFHAELRRSVEKWDYWRHDISYDFIFKLQVTLNEKLTFGWPVGGVHWEIIERESITDVVKPDLPTLEDLGIALTPMEEYVSWVYRPYRRYMYHDEELQEFTRPVPPQPI
ncbi:NADH:ubiquinone oxidoreductase subunit 39 [Lycorma delicatula]|uniref:NADH:ubiquinone oxidoreductase subunit 39 n=1 Tax=Lycorma delicatula TaxID=130591 RepID=UPI003F513C4B